MGNGMSNKISFYISFIKQACGHRNFSAHHLFKQAFDLLQEGDGLNGKRILEVCCGEGDLSVWLASNYPSSQIIGVDLDNSKILKAREKITGLNNIEIIREDVFNLNSFENESFDLIVVQATLHHLSHNSIGASKEFSRLLKQKGKCIFLYEPLGHNGIFAAIRAKRNSRYHDLDESNLYYEAFNIFGKNFNNYEVYTFNLLNYLCKILPDTYISRFISKIVSRIDQIIFNKFQFMKKYAANCNLCFGK